MFKKYIFVIVFLVFQIIVFSQEKNYNYPHDSLMPDLVLVKNSSLSFLIQDDKYYSFYINEIIPLKQGYFIYCITKIDTFTVTAFVITDKSTALFSAKNIKQFETYNLSLKRYFEKPTISGTHLYKNLDVMLGDNTVNVGASGCFNYIFTSQNLIGLSYIDSLKVKKQLKKYELEKNEIRNTLEPFINAISFKEYSMNVGSYIDTHLLKKSIKKYSKYFASRSPEYFSTPQKLYPPYEVELIDWNEDFDINPNDFSSLFWFMLMEYYGLPKKRIIDSHLILSNDIKLELIHISKNGTYTIRTKWRMFENEDEYCAMINIKKEKNKYTIIGFNRPDDFY